jgi:cytochrome c peroxidase
MVELGRKLFFDPRLSENNTVSCATCHNPRKGWADGLELAVGIRGSVGTRHSPSIINSSYTPLVFWDGRTTGFVTQALLPLSNRLEMGNQTEQQVITKLRTIPGYQKLFLEAFPSPRQLDPQTLSPVTGVNLAMAIAAFESTVTSFNAPIDRRLDGDLSALSADAEVGFGIFQQSNCMSCHTPPLFTDNSFHNNGMEFAGRLLARGQQYDRGRAGPPINSRRPSDERAFKTPTLREIARTAPYNHAGNFATLERVVIHYNAGGRRYDDYVDRFMDPRIRPLGLSESQMRYLVIFLKEAFAGSNYPMITEPQLP